MSGDDQRTADDARQIDQVLMLSGRVIVVVDETPIDIVGPALRFLVSRLALAAPGEVATDELIYKGRTPGSVHTNVKRLRNEYGIPIVNAEKVNGYSMRVPRRQVDALRLLDAADKPGSDDDGSVLELWSTGPVSLPVPAAIRMHEMLHMAKAKLQQRTARRKQVLIVDDDQAEDVAKRLRVDGVHCVTASSAEEFERLTAQLSDFDLLVLDLHLTPGRNDESGLKVADRVLELGSDIPILGMSFKVPQNRPYGELMAEYYDRGLVDLVSKKVEGLPDFELLADRVQRCLAEPDKGASSVEQIRRRLPDWRKTALAYLDYGNADGPRRNSFKADYEQLFALASENTPHLGVIRSRYRRFRIEWLTAREARR